jgi:acyl-CoA thioesterase II
MTSSNTPSNTPPSAPASGGTAPSVVDNLVKLLDLERLETNLFRGVSPPSGWNRVYGGQVLAQALVAAQRTVTDDRVVHSMHAYFLLAGEPKVPIVYDVEQVRDGGSFSTRRVKAIQNGQPMYVMSASFQKHEVSLDHQAEMPVVPGPETLASQDDLLKMLAGKIPLSMANYLTRDRPIDMRLVEVDRYMSRKKAKPAQQHVWMRAKGRLPDDPKVHQAVLAYASDATLLDTALTAHGKLLFDTDIQMASLDHSMWFHRPFRADEWLLFAQDSPSAGGARGFCRGSIYRQDGVLVASVTQEGLVRQRDPQRRPKV